MAAAAAYQSYFCFSEMARYFLIYFIFTSCLVAGQSPEYALKGQKVSLKPVSPGSPDQILWKHNGNKVVEFNGKEQAEYSPYEHRITLDWFSAELDITDLRFEDSGNYDLEAYVNNKLYRSHFPLEVIDRVAKPTISCEMNDGSGSNMISGKLVCSAEPRQPDSLMKFEWSSHGTVQRGPELTISLGDKHDDEIYSCIVSNPLSSETATFTAKDCHPVSSFAALTATLVTLGVIVAIAAGSVIIFCKRNHKACFARDLEKSSPPGTREAQDEETEKLLDRAPTLRSTQRLNQAQSMDIPNEMPPKGYVKDTVKKYEQKGNKSPSHAEPSNLASYDKGHDAGIIKIVENPTESNNEELEKVETSPASTETSSSAQPPSPLTKSSPNIPPEDTAAEHKEESDSDLANKEPVRESNSSGIHQKRNESDHCSEEKQSSSVPEQNSSETTQHEKSPDTAHADSDRGEDDKTRQDSVESKGQPDSSTAEADKGHDAGIIKIVENPTESNNEELEKVETSPANTKTSSSAQPPSPLTKSSPNIPPEDTAAEHKEESDSDLANKEPVRESNSSGIHQKRNESDHCSEEKQSSSVPEQNSSETTQHEKSPDTAHADSDRGEDDKTRQDSVESKGQPDSSTAEADEGHDAGIIKIVENPTESNNEELKKVETSPASTETSSSAQPPSPLTKSSPNIPPEDTAAEHKEESDSDLANKEPVRESDSSGIHQKRNESDHCSKEKQSSSVPEQNSSETTQHEKSPDTAHADSDRGEDDKTRQDSVESKGQPDSSTAEADKAGVAEMISNFEKLNVSKNQELKKVETSPASTETSSSAQPPSPLTKSSPNIPPEDTAAEHKEESDSDLANKEPVRESDSSGIHQKRNESDHCSEEKQSSSVPEQNSSETTQHEKSPDTAHADSDRGEDDKTRQDKSEGQPDSSTAEADKGHDEGMNINTRESKNQELKKVQTSPASAETSANGPPPSPLTKSSSDIPPEDTGAAHKDESDSDLANKEPRESN